MPSPEPEPDKRCGTCEHYCPRLGEGWCYEFAQHVSEYSGTQCHAWTPKPTPETKKK